MYAEIQTQTEKWKEHIIKQLSEYFSSSRTDFQLNLAKKVQKLYDCLKDSDFKGPVDFDADKKERTLRGLLDQYTSTE